MQYEREFSNWDRLSVSLPDPRTLVPISVIEQTLNQMRDEGQSRYPLLEFYPTMAAIRFGDFAAEQVILDDELVSRVAEEERVMRRPLNLEQVIRLALANTANCVRPGFSADALNDLNRVFYGRNSDEFTSVMVGSIPLQKALAGFIEAEFEGKTIRVKELAAGANVYKRWQEVDRNLPAGKQVEVVATDFSTNTLPNPEQLQFEAGQVSMTAEVYDLSESMQPVDSQDRFDVMLASFAFDSVWQSGDITLVKFNDKWYQELYRLRVHDRWPKRDEFLAVLRGESVTVDFEREDFHRVEVERILVPFKPDDHQFGRDIIEHYRRASVARFNFPAGIIRRVEEAFEHQLTDSGIFVILDCATNDPWGGMIDPTGQKGAPNEAFEKVGALDRFKDAAYYKPENFNLAAKILQEHGFRVEVVLVNDFIAQNGDEYPEVDQFGPNNWAMIVRKA